MTGTTTADLDTFARDYYLGRGADDLDLEERQQELSLERLRPFLQGRVLELGFGTGRMAATLLRAGVDTSVVEGSPLLVEEARRRHPHLDVYEGMFESFVPPGPVDTLLAAHVFEHVDDPRSLMVHLRSWLRPGGTLIAVVPNAESLHRRLAVRMGLQPELDTLSPRDHLVGHQRVYTIAGLGDDMRAAGYDVREATGWFLKTVPNSMMLGWPQELIDSLFGISEELDPRQLANIAVVATRE
ncbi:bifunctional 2-polyprenyl-6-hydroxyphenol methylase/3-demethylubiquinol 3-O-methyltransferase UbiG [Conexibacter sp. CPCC 206217]|uniref:class I SAM-dependent methyltransferase n=1 Tax=Conexibacter sp. CPCC 206217 TaxID=3064574 RepID=UPI00271F1F1E|nr:class I SAM-dependent methyltransferase [Conexibacter sp. CPCC 206217]MDO8211378.1 class I SAM-dependent methyltransferase [Conexibacter sp. CPCC 206217]